MKSLSSAQCNNILSLLDKGHSTRQIAASTGISRMSISRIRSKHRSSLSKSLGGRPSILSDANIRHAVHLITTQKAETATQVAKTLGNIIQSSVSSKTVARHLKQVGMKAVVKKKRPLLTAKHRKARLEFAEAHKDWTREDWKCVIWSDETKINRLGSDGRKWAWKKAGEGLSDRLVQGTLKFGGGSVMVWGCMTWEGVGMATKIDGKMDGDLYVAILEDELQGTLEYYGKEVDEVIFQQDNDPKHTCKKAKAWFQDHGFKVMEWPAQSPDINPIEHLWGHLKRRLGECESPPKGILELWERIEETWEGIPVETCQKLIESMPDRIAAVLKAKGGYTKY
jgi:transposase